MIDEVRLPLATVLAGLTLLLMDGAFERGPQDEGQRSRASRWVCRGVVQDAVGRD